MSTGATITILGTGTSQGIPVIGCTCKVCTSSDPRDKRLRTAAYYSSDGIGISIDIGPDFRYQMLRAEHHDVHAVIMTHEHNDHIMGLDDLRPVNFRHHRSIPIYGSKRTLSEMQRRFYYAFDDSYIYVGKPDVVPIEIQHDPFHIEHLTVTPIPVVHGELPILGYRIGDFAYVTDAKYIPDSSRDKMRNLDVLILNALRFREHPTHLTVKEAIEVVEDLQPARCYLTHISHDMGLHAETEKQLPPGMYLAQDNLTLAL